MEVNVRIVRSKTAKGLRALTFDSIEERDEFIYWINEHKRIQPGFLVMGIGTKPSSTLDSVAQEALKAMAARRRRG